MSIQSSINSMIGSLSRAAMVTKGYAKLKQKQVEPEASIQPTTRIGSATPAASVQQQAAVAAKESVKAAVAAKRVQRRNFNEYLKAQPLVRGTIGDLSEETQKKIAAAYTPAMRKEYMDEVDKRGGLNNGKH